MSLTPFVRRILRSARYAPERVWHPVRRRRALRQLAGHPRPRKVLFVCHGNICRSPYAAHLFASRRNGNGSIAVESAGFIGPDRPCPDTAIEVAAERGIDLNRHRSTLITRTALTSSDLIVVMDASQKWRLEIEHGVPSSRILVLGDLDPRLIDRRTIRDPVEQPAEVFAASYDRIDRCVTALWEALG